ncbi:baseplate J/gp47 family protein [Jeongeupia chitinilytica]|uniref:Tail protein n=1 Tax=Jeongeupia chitinilytica TaxID=1041641 RepID=A0ABQ3GXW3_9NEIS|nr:baseplate J/gp47 family protein [Jeongeupia chitinilytica]GHD60430.1 tail protein [Jeongeupia chitinilytica]
MPYPKPGLNQIAGRITTDWLQRLAQGKAPIPAPGSLASMLAQGLAGAFNGLYGYGDWIYRQQHPATCDADTLMARDVPMFLKDGPKPAVAATGVVQFAAPAGAMIAAGAQVQRVDGALFLATAAASTGDDLQIRLPVVAELTGPAGNTAAGETMTLVSPVGGVAAQGTVAGAGLTGGVDAESVDEIRGRVIAARRNGGQVGKSGDWELWALEVPGVTRAWAAPQLLGLGEITVFFVRDDDTDGIFPDAAEQAAMKTWLEANGTPFGEVWGASPKPKPVDFSIRLAPDSPALRDAVLASLQSVFALEAAPVARYTDGTTVLPVAGVTLPLTHFAEAISTTVGEFDHDLIAPSADVVCEVGELAQLGTVTWTS